MAFTPDQLAQMQAQQQQGWAAQTAATNAQKSDPAYQAAMTNRSAQNAMNPHSFGGENQALAAQNPTHPNVAPQSAPAPFGPMTPVGPSQAPRTNYWMNPDGSTGTPTQGMAPPPWAGGNSGMGNGRMPAGAEMNGWTGPSTPPSQSGPMMPGQGGMNAATKPLGLGQAMTSGGGDTFGGMNLGAELGGNSSLQQPSGGGASSMPAGGLQAMIAALRGYTGGNGASNGMQQPSMQPTYQAY